MRGLARLQIDRTPGALRYRLEVPDHDGTTLEEIEHPVSDEALADTLAEAAALLHHPEVLGFGERAVLVGQRSYRNLVPLKLREQLADLRLPILLITRLPDFPFEIFHDGKEFLGIRFAVGRRVVTQREGSAGAKLQSPQGGRLEVLVIGSNPRGDLPFAESEAEAIHSCLARGLGKRANTSLLITSPVAGQAAFHDVTSRLAQGVDILHYSGHVERRADGRVGLLLADERLLSVDDVANNLQRAPIVFLNGCASARQSQKPEPAAWQDDLISIAGGFIRGGARAVIGTMSDVSDRYAAVLAEEFYRHTAADVPLGEALRRARAHCRDRALDSSAWLSFMLYGNPLQRFPSRHGIAAAPFDGQSRLAVFMSVDMINAHGDSALPPTSAAYQTAAFERIFTEVMSDVPGGDILTAIGSQITARFTTASSAVEAALRFQRELTRESMGVSTRIGIDLREVSEFDPDGDGILKVVGAPTEIAEQLRKLALPGQILLSRSAFDSARVRFSHPITTNLISEGSLVQWLAHGQYFLEGSEDPIHLFETGIEGKAPLCPPPDSQIGRRRLETDEVDGWRPALGSGIPRRENWVLEQKLGEGGFGEVWLARHTRLREARVFKFCFDKMRLRSFRREITIFRLLREELGTQPDIVRLYDVELEKPPYFLESEYIPHGNLAQWAGEQGGVAKLQLDVRLDVFVRTACALSAAHSIGVLHKDLKPSNILIREETPGSFVPCLTDFGIGELTDPTRLMDHSITPAGLTTAAHDEQLGKAGTRLYAPPESQVGKAHTQQGDIYALGVLLFQLVVGDFDRPLAPGWERLIDDELLRGDIGTMVEGDPAARLGSAAMAAELIRRLPERRAELKEQQRVARRRRLMVRTGAAVIVFAFSLGLALRAYEARQSIEFERYRHAIQDSLNLLNAGKSDDARAMLQAAPPHLRHWEWNYLWRGANRVVYEGNPYRAVVLTNGRLWVDTGGDDERTWRGSTGIPLVPDDTLCFAWLGPGGNRVVSIPRATNGQPRYELWNRASGARLATGGLLRVAASNSRPTDEPALTNGCPPVLRLVSNDDASYFMIDGSVVPVVIDADQGALLAQVATPEDKAALRSFGFSIDDDDKVSHRNRMPGIPVVSATSPDRSLVATIGETHDTLELRDRASGVQRSEVKVPSGAYKVEFSPRGDKILGLSWDQLWLWTIGHSSIDFVSRLGDPSAPPLRSYSEVTFTGFNDDGSQAVAISNRFRVFDTSGVDYRGPVVSAHLLYRLSRNGKFGLDPRRGHAAVVDLSTAREVRGLSDDVSGSDWLHTWFGDADTIVSLSRKGDVRVSDAATGRVEWAHPLADGRSLVTERADFEANRVAVSNGNIVHVFEITNVQRIREVATLPLKGGSYFKLSPDGLRMVIHVATDNRQNGPAEIPVIDRIEVWDLATATRVATSHCGSAFGVGAIFSPNGHWLLTNCGLPAADIWNAKTGASVRQLSGFDGGIHSAEFSQDGQYAVTVGQWDSRVSVWNVQSSAQPTKLSVGQTKWSQASFSPDGKRVVGARGDGTITVWDVATGTFLLTLGEPYPDDINRATSASFTADGRAIVFLCENVTRIWGY